MFPAPNYYRDMAYLRSLDRLPTEEWAAGHLAYARKCREEMAAIVSDIGRRDDRP